MAGIKFCLSYLHPGHVVVCILLLRLLLLNCRPIQSILVFNSYPIMSNGSDPSQNPAHEHYYVDPNWPDPNGPRDAREY